MSGFFDFLKSAAKAVNQMENVVNKVSDIREEVGNNRTQTSKTEGAKSSEPLKYTELLAQYGAVSCEKKKQFDFDAYMFRPIFRVVCSLPDSADYEQAGDCGFPGIYDTYTYRGFDRAYFCVGYEQDVDAITRDTLFEIGDRDFEKYSILDYQEISNPHFEIRGEIANEKLHVVRYVHTLPGGDVLYADCQIYRDAVSSKESTQIMKDFEDMIANIQYSDQLLATYQSQ